MPLKITGRRNHLSDKPITYKERSIRNGNEVVVEVNGVPTRSYTFSNPYTAEMFCRMTNPIKSKSWRLTKSA